MSVPTWVRLPDDYVEITINCPAVMVYKEFAWLIDSKGGRIELTEVEPGRWIIDRSAKTDSPTEASE